MKMELREGGEVMEALDRIKDLPKEELYAIGDSIVEEVRTYPPPRANSTYVRTNRLKKGWSISKMSGSVEISNDVEYAGWVQGESQVQIHEETGWIKLWDSATGNLNAGIQTIWEKIASIWRS